MPRISSVQYIHKTDEKQKEEPTVIGSQEKKGIRRDHSAVKNFNLNKTTRSKNMPFEQDYLLQERNNEFGRTRSVGSFEISPQVKLRQDVSFDSSAKSCKNKQTEVLNPFNVSDHILQCGSHLTG